MCGITGVFHYGEPERPVDVDALSRATRRLAHRGPDDERIWIDGPVGLGHRRLSILDLTEAGRQPMPSADGRCQIVYNGEFYTHRAYRRRLEEKGVAFRGSSDTETLVNLLQQEGLRALKDPSAIFAFAFWDGRRRELTLARDPLGVKQLYYHDDGRRVVFASEIKALLEWPDVPRRPDLVAVNQYLHFHTPLFDRTFFDDIRQVEPGQALVYRDGRRHDRLYWRLEVPEPAPRRDDSVLDELKQVLQDVVRDQLLSDVPVGAFFSGGIDSSAVAAFALRSGYRPKLFGVHFVDPSVVDERPFQESAAKAMGLDLRLLTVDASSFPEDMARLLEAQDQPVIGPAMIPMYHVSRLASRHVKVCLGGQAADEIFGGYARYALTRPWSVARSWFSRRDVGSDVGKGGRVGGNLWKQLAETRTWRRLLGNSGLFGGWERRYFENFAPIPENEWTALMPEAGVSRSACRDVFAERIRSNAVKDPASAAMLWDVQTYLPGLFHQDDRMSMANGLESRVPLADPRLVRLAFQMDFRLKFRGGASKWVLRKAVADVVPPEVLNRRKIGFDTPAESWMRGPHAGFVRDILLGKTARERGLWDAKAMERLLSGPDDAHWFLKAWKALCVEIWARRFLDGTSGSSWTSVPSPRSERPGWRDYVQELRELGPGQTLFRVGWELSHRSGLKAIAPRGAGGSASTVSAGAAARLGALRVFSSWEAVGGWMRSRLTSDEGARLLSLAEEAGQGRILCFSRWTGDYGDPLDWHVNPVNRVRWRSDAHWSLALRDEARVGDVKLTWEIGRFPQAYHLARAAAYAPERREEFARTFRTHVRSFLDQNPEGSGVHWASGQEMVFRTLAWLFALRVFSKTAALDEPFLRGVAEHLYAVGRHLEANIEYARKSVYNNHLLSEALGLRILGDLLGDAPESARWRTTGEKILVEQADAQFAPDGGYIQNSHTYHRVALQILLGAWAWERSEGRPLPAPLRSAMRRSVDFLGAHQNPGDGRLPNFGANDGSLPLVLNSCDYSDFRPVLQAASLVADGVRRYGEGPWDESSAWLLGLEALSGPLKAVEPLTVSFAESGYHVLRGKESGSFGAFRAGSLRQRFSQIDMLHLDVWWRGQNVLVDGGTYLYNGPARWHDHFFRTGSHNTVQVDGHDQMVHLRKFKSVYLTRAAALGVRAGEGWASMAGEHYGYQRYSGRVVHRRQVVFLHDDVWVVADTLLGAGEHDCRLHWLGGPFPHEVRDGALRLLTPGGAFDVRCMDEEGRPLPGSVVVGREDPPRGWLSRYYGEKTPVPSFVVQVRRQLPATLISVLSAGEVRTRISGQDWTLEHSQGKIRFACAPSGMDLKGVDARP